MNRIIYTVGTSNRSIEQFTGLLKKYGIEIIIDVRSFPTSRFEHFKQKNLSSHLKEADIGYIHLKELVGYRRGGYRKGGYRSHMKTSEFKEGLKKLEEIAETKKAAIVCAEKLPWKCHRRYITNELSGRGWEIEHIIDEKSGSQKALKEL